MFFQNKSRMVQYCYLLLIMQICSNNVYGVLFRQKRNKDDIDLIIPIGHRNALWYPWHMHRFVVGGGWESFFISIWLSCLPENYSSNRHANHTLHNILFFIKTVFLLLFF